MRGRITLDRGSVASWAPALAVVAIAALLRFADLDLKPFHHDEGVNGYFLESLYRHGVYHYNPSDYHGPTLVFLAWLSAHVFGLTDFAVRLVPAVCGVGVIALTLGLRGRLGRAGAISAAALLAVSPGAVYFSRYFIHETLFILLTLALVVISARYRDSPRLALAAAGGAVLALMYATKETAVLAVPVLVLAVLAAHYYARLRGLSGAPLLPRPERPWAAVAIALGTFAVSGALLFSVFFTDTPGIGKALEALRFWSDTGTSAYKAPLSTYLEWLAQEDLAVLALGLGGCIAVLVRPSHRFELFCAFWALGTVAQYSLIPYKTPWLAVNMIVPLGLAAGCGVGVLVRMQRPAWRVAAAVLVAGAVTFSAYRAVVLNFDRYDDEGGAYAYAHTQRGTLELLREIERLAAADGTGKDVPIAVTSRDYWPLPWYLRDYTRSSFGGISGQATPQALVVESQAESQEAPSGLRGYRIAGSYTLRPGVVLDLYARADLLRPNQ